MHSNMPPPPDGCMVVPYLNVISSGRFYRNMKKYTDRNKMLKCEFKSALLRKLSLSLTSSFIVTCDSFLVLI